jgi:hypothetical protein
MPLHAEDVVQNVVCYHVPQNCIGLQPTGFSRGLRNMYKGWPNCIPPRDNATPGSQAPARSKFGMAAMRDAPLPTLLYWPDTRDASICIVSHFLILTAGCVAFLKGTTLFMDAASALTGILKVSLVYCSQHVRLCSFVTKATSPQRRA